MKLDLANLSIRQIQQQFLQRERPVSRQLLQRLQADPRRGLKPLATRLRQQREQQKWERARLRRMLRYERRLWKAGVRRVAGVDEVGMGPLAGPIVAAAVVFSPGIWIHAIDDSKKLKAELRNRLAQLIQEKAEGVGIGQVEVTELDDLNIYQAGLVAMKRAVQSLPQCPQRVITDARKIPGLPMPQDCFPQGDQTHFSIAAASIVAKVHRDAQMLNLDRLYPQYGFARHKGYPTREHKLAIREHGLSDVHRKSLASVKELSGQCSRLFYELQSRLQRIESYAALEKFQGRMRSRSPDLPAPERRRLAFHLSQKSKRLL